MEINDPECPLLVQLKELSKEEYYHAIHTAYLGDKVARLLLDKYFLHFAYLSYGNLISPELENYRNIDAETDVLSFPNLEFEVPGDFSGAEESGADCFDPDSGELVLVYSSLSSAAEL